MECGESTLAGDAVLQGGTCGDQCCTEPIWEPGGTPCLSTTMSRRRCGSNGSSGLSGWSMSAQKLANPENKQLAKYIAEFGPQTTA